MDVDVDLQIPYPGYLKTCLFLSDLEEVYRKLESVSQHIVISEETKITDVLQRRTRIQEANLT